ncbi:hypothetical protein NPIL_146241 [Nephila pilipes]|uniref:Uncharacterized protein n=1 Tax=Nephila pilipes TaxID=299642 RepID=A0A8X6U976_NEPPI|nr:hypothetical protein NPIL_146241 [Nephila pilipes]
MAKAAVCQRAGKRQVCLRAMLFFAQYVDGLASKRAYAHARLAVLYAAWWFCRGRFATAARCRARQGERRLSRYVRTRTFATLARLPRVRLAV